MDEIRKRKRVSTDYHLCVICQKSSSESLQKVTINGVQSLSYAVTNRNDETALRLRGEFADGDEQFLANSPLYHAKCRNSYTNKKTVNQKMKLFSQDHEVGEENVAHSGTSAPRPMRGSSATGCIDHKAQCFICRRERTSKGEHKLLLVTMPERQKSIWMKAKELGDEDMLYHIQGFGDTCIDMIAGDFKYHRSCLCAYLTKTRPLPAGTSRQQDEGLKWLISYIDDTLAQDPNDVIFLSSLRDKYRIWMSEHGNMNAQSYRSSSLKKKIEDYYSGNNSRVIIVPQKGQSSIICSSNMSIGFLLSKVANLRKQMDDEEYAEESDDETIGTGTSQERNIVLYHSAKSLRTDIKTTAAKLRESRQADGASSTMEITFDAANECVPISLYNYVAWLVTDATPEWDESGKQVKLHEHEHEKVLHLAQDICSAVANIPNPKHIGTALHILKQTRSKEVVTLLNRFGNSISYQDAQRYITSMAQPLTEEDQRVQDESWVIPSNLKFGLFTQCAIDNLDFHEHTPDGTTMHGTTHNIYQYPSNEDDAPTSKASIPLTKKQRKASCTGIQQFHTKDSGLSLRDRQQSRSLCGLSLTPHPKTTNLLSDNTVAWQLIQNDTLQTDEKKNIVSWNHFHELLTDDKKPQTLIGYGPFFPESPTKPDVVEASVEYCIAVTKKLGQKYCILTCDQAIYEITLGLQKKKPDKYDNLILRMGGFHIANNFLGAIGCLFKSSGIEEVIVEAKVFRAGTMNKLMAGKDYYDMLRCHSLMMSTMLELYWESFESWVLNEPDTHLDVMASLTEATQKLADAVAQENRTAASLARIEMAELGDRVGLLLTEFDQTFSNSPTAKLWIMYIDMVLILKAYVEAERIGCWEDHLNQVEKMLPYLVSAGHIKYVACLPHYLTAMKNLPPEIAEEFQNGHFNVRVTAGKFNAVWTDMALEQTYNCEAKTQLFKGITQQASAREKYLRALPALTAVSEQTKAMAHMQAETRTSTNTKALRDRSLVDSMKRLLKDEMINPFSCTSGDLLNIATGEKCRSLELIDAKSIGLSALARAETKQSRQVESVRLQTFELKGSKRVKSKQATIYREETSVLRSLCFIEDKDKDAFSYEWTEYPSSLFEPNQDMALGYAMRKGNKADYIAVTKDELSDSWREEDQLPDTNEGVLFIVDAMAFVHRNQDIGCSTFADLQANYLRKLISSSPANSTCINVVGDRYDIELSKSLKVDERIRRQKSQQASRTYEIKDSLPIPPWKPFITNPMNKSALQNYLATSWTEHHKTIPQGVKLMIGGLFKETDRAVVITTDGSNVVPELACKDHEEADTRIFAHIAYCVRQYGYTRVVVQATDTDILVLAIYYSIRIPGLKELWLQKGSTYIPCHRIVSALSEKYNLPNLLATSALLCGHIMSGCDTVSYTFGKGKKKAFKVIMMNASELHAMTDFGDTSISVTGDVSQACRSFFVKLYADFSGNLDLLRAHLFSRSKADLRKLPPTESAFKYHMLRGLYQIATSKRAHHCYLNLPEATSFGRHILNGQLVPTMMDKPAKPPALKQKRFCHCSKSKCKRNCSCAAAGVSCVIACNCSANPAKCARIVEDSDDAE